MTVFSKIALSFAAIFAIIAVVLAAARDSDVLINQENADAINKMSGKKTWIASAEQGYLSGATIGDIKKRLGWKKSNKARTLITNVIDALGVPVKGEAPASFNAADHWPECAERINHIRDQSSCGSCWSESTTEAASDRFCTYGIHKNLSISAANVMECCWFCGQGCGGGEPVEAFEYMKTSGVPATECQPYPFPSCSHHVTSPTIPPCPKTEYPTPQCPGSVCTTNRSNVPFQKYYFESAYSLAGEEQYKQELVTNGPFAVAFSVYSDFPTYKSGVYQHTSGTYLGGHAVKLVGYGTENGTPYWLIANSWNPTWGLNGFFKILRGQNECGIEQSGAAGAPKKI